MKSYRICLILCSVNLYQYNYSCSYVENSKNVDVGINEYEKLQINLITLLDNLEETEKNTLIKIHQKPIDSFEKVTEMYVNSSKKDIERKISYLKNSKKYIKNLLSKFCLQYLKVELIDRNKNKIEISHQFYKYFNEVILDIDDDDRKVNNNIDKKNLICFSYRQTKNEELHFCFLSKKMLENINIKKFFTVEKKKIIKLNSNLFLYFSKWYNKDRIIYDEIYHQYEISQELRKNEDDNTYELYIIFKEK